MCPVLRVSRSQKDHNSVGVGNVGQGDTRVGVQDLVQLTLATGSQGPGFRLWAFYSAPHPLP